MFKVTGLNLSDNCKILDVAASVGATVVGVKKDLYLMHNYQIRKITSKSHQSHQRFDNSNVFFQYTYFLQNRFLSLYFAALT